MSGQTLTDRIAAAQYGLTGSEVARAVCKATTHEVMAPKKKHLEYKGKMFWSSIGGQPLRLAWSRSSRALHTIIFSSSASLKVFFDSPVSCVGFQ
ncbi:hypothetical protein P4O66_014130 [Electrophorus voltai]|uniref:ENTH domain-containing protein n=1 Tax=Electrophorus voltai TaxID=2609070 RepID=A0AAD8Z0L7_9TELE|nr:hypothetical protein P4O66_014130 [Electrophorus voltai]